jgi:hypothetical protein
MKKIDKVLKQLDDLYEFNRRIRRYEVKKKKAAKKIRPSKTRLNNT